MIPTRAGALDAEDIGSTISVELPGRTHRTGTLTGLHHGTDSMVRIEIAGRHIVTSSRTPVTIHTEGGDTQCPPSSATKPPTRNTA